MATTFLGDIPGNRFQFVENVASQASGTDSYVPLFRAPQALSVLAAYFIPATAQAGAGTDYKTIQVINRGAAGTGTTVVASKAYSAASLSTASFVGAALTVNTAASTVTTSQTLAWYTTSTGSGIAIVAGQLQVEYQLT